MTNTTAQRLRQGLPAEPSFKVTKEEHELIGKIVDQAAKHLNFPRMDTMMDLTVCHANGCPLKLAELLALGSDPEGDGFYDFAHDLGGIRRHLNRQTGELEDCFVPRLAAPVQP